MPVQIWASISSEFIPDVLLTVVDKTLNSMMGEMYFYAQISRTSEFRRIPGFTYNPSHCFCISVIHSHGLGFLERAKALHCRAGRSPSFWTLGLTFPGFIGTCGPVDLRFQYRLFYLTIITALASLKSPLKWTCKSILDPQNLGLASPN